MIAIYARQSVDKKDSISIESQIEKCKTELKENESYKVYSDKGFSGKNTDRPNFIQMMKDIKQGLITKVVVYKVDRISRAIVDFGNMMIEFQKYHVQFISFSEKFDTTTPIGVAMLNIIMVFAQLERETIQQRITDNYYERGKHGYYLGGVAPYGYIKIPTMLNNKKTYTYKPDESTINIVQWIYQKYVIENFSMNQIARTLNEHKYKTRTNHIWTSIAINRILHNPVYVKADADIYSFYKQQNTTINNDITDFIGINGCYIYGFNSQKHTVNRFADLSQAYLTLGMHKGIIESDIWLKAQYRMKDNQQVKNSKHGTHSWLSGLMKCGYCGMAITVVPNSRKHNYINCSGRKLHVCYGRKKVIHLEDIEGFVEENLLNHIKTYYSNIQNSNPKPNPNVNNPKINQLKIQLTQIEQKIDNLVDAIANGNSESIIYLNNAIKKIDIERKKIIQDIQKNQKIGQQEEKRNSSSMIESIHNWDTLDIPDRKIIAQSFIEKVIITDDKIVINYIE